MGAFKYWFMNFGISACKKIVESMREMSFSVNMNDQIRMRGIFYWPIKMV